MFWGEGIYKSQCFREQECVSSRERERLWEYMLWEGEDFMGVSILGEGQESTEYYENSS